LRGGLICLASARTANNGYVGNSVSHQLEWSEQLSWRRTVLSFLPRES
jgi:hypothetical protein